MTRLGHGSGPGVASREAQGASAPRAGQGILPGPAGDIPRAAAPGLGTLLRGELGQGTPRVTQHGLQLAGKPHRVVLLPSDGQTDRQTRTGVPCELSSSSSCSPGDCSTRSNPTLAESPRAGADTSYPHSVGQGGSGPPGDAGESLGN